MEVVHIVFEHPIVIAVIFFMGISLGVFLMHAWMENQLSKRSIR